LVVQENVYFPVSLQPGDRVNGDAATHIRRVSFRRPSRAAGSSPSKPSPNRRPASSGFTRAPPLWPFGRSEPPPGTKSLAQ
jgi:hypothetical protein